MTLKPLPLALFAVTVALELAAVILSAGLEPAYDTWIYAFKALATAGAGALVASRCPENPIGWILCGSAFTAMLSDLGQGWGLRAAEESWPWGPLAEWTALWTWLPGGLGFALTFLLFPDGHLPSPRWRWVPWIGAVGMLLAVPGWSLSPERGPDFVEGSNPLAVEGVTPDILLAVGMTLFLATFVASASALVVRFRRSRGVERQQLKWFAFAAGFAAVALPIAFALWDRSDAARVLAAIAVTSVPLAACIAILRYRLYDIDLVINRTLVYGVLSVSLAAVYLTIALLLGLAVGSGSALASAVATLAAAVAFRPLRARVQDAVDRRLGRARYDALHRLTSFLEDVRAGRATPEEVETVLREVLADPSLELRFLLPESERYVDAQGLAPVDQPGDTRERIAIERAGTPLGMVLHDPTIQEHPALLRRVVEAAGLAIEIVRLRVELRSQLEEVAESRARIVTAGDAERRRIERDLHDGAQQRLVSIGLALRHAQHELDPDASARRTLDGALVEVTDAIRELRELARGLRPAQLDAGLGAALRELASRAALPVEVRATDERFPDHVEAAAYFIACEGLTNAAKHAQASSVTLSAGRENGSLVVSVADDGIGGASPVDGSGLSGLLDRVAAQGGGLRIESNPGAGTRLIAKLPCES